MLPLHSNMVLAAQVRALMVHRVEIFSREDGVTAEDVPASIQSEESLTTRITEFGGAWQEQYVDVFLPPELPDGGRYTGNNTATLRVTSSLLTSYVGLTLPVTAIAIDDTGLYLRIKSRVSSWGSSGG